MEPKSKGRPPMKPKKTVKIQQNESSLSDKERIREFEVENARLKYEISFYDDFIKEMREIAKPIVMAVFCIPIRDGNTGMHFIRKP